MEIRNIYNKDIDLDIKYFIRQVLKNVKQYLQNIEFFKNVIYV